MMKELARIGMKTLLLILFFTTMNCYAQSISKCIVSRIIDGDTLVCKTENTKEEVIRLIGIDTPESTITSKTYRDSVRTGHSIETIRNMGEKSKKHLMKKVKIGTEINLEFDVQKKDKYGRTLAYVYLPDGTMLNELMLSEGYAQVMTISPNLKYQDLFIQSHQNAIANKKGLWK